MPNEGLHEEREELKEAPKGLGRTGVESEELDPNERKSTKIRGSANLETAVLHALARIGASPRFTKPGTLVQILHGGGKFDGHAVGYKCVVGELLAIGKDYIKVMNRTKPQIIYFKDIDVIKDATDGERFTHLWDNKQNEALVNESGIKTDRTIIQNLTPSHDTKYAFTLTLAEPHSTVYCIVTGKRECQLPDGRPVTMLKIAIIKNQVPLSLRRQSKPPVNAVEETEVALENIVNAKRLMVIIPPKS